VTPEFRRRGIGTALKLQGILYARRRGFGRSVTAPRITNQASLGMNLKVGLRPSAGAPV
jgi:GNAT superfamily N-acetyltransferase